MRLTQPINKRGRVRVSQQVRFPPTAPSSRWLTPSFSDLTATRYLPGVMDPGPTTGPI
jgi:hypothetical protein